MTERSHVPLLILPAEPFAGFHPFSLRFFLRRFRRNRFWLLLFLWLAAAVPELVVHTAVSDTIAQWLSPGLITGPLMAFSGALGVFLLCTAFPGRAVNRWIATGYTGLMFLLHGVQLIIYSSTGQFQLSPATGGLSILSHWRTLVPVLWKCTPQLLLMGLPLGILVTLGKQLFSFRPLKQWKQHIPMAVCFVLAQMLVLLLVSSFSGAGDARVLVSRLGLMGALRVEARNRYADRDPAVAEKPDIQPPPETVTAPEWTAHLMPGDWPSPSAPDYLALADAENRDSIARIHRYFAECTPTPAHDKTGIFQGCNLILITAGDISLGEVSPGLTPTLSGMMQQGWSFSDFYAPDWGTPSDGLYALLTGTIPVSGGNSLRSCTENRMPLTMGQVLLRRGYSAWAFHRCHSWSCEDARCLELLGYEWLGCFSGSPAEMLDNASDRFTTGEPFTLFCDLGTLQDLRELEEAMALLNVRLEAAGTLDNTVIVLVSSPGSGAVSADVPGSCLIWKSGIPPETVSAPASTLDLLPTLSGLFGPEYDTRLYPGRDVFSNAMPLVVFPDHSRIPNSVSDREVETLFSISAGILETDYWRYLYE